MMQRITLLALLAAGLMTTSAFACAPVTDVDATTGDIVRSGTPEWDRREQADWRAKSEIVVLAQIRAGRIGSGADVEFVMAPVAPVYGGDLPAQDLHFIWQPGSTCNRFDLTIADTVIAFVNSRGDIVGLTIPENLQDRPPQFNAWLREIDRGLIGPRAEELKQ